MSLVYTKTSTLASRVLEMLRMVNPQIWPEIKSSYDLRPL